MVGDWLLTVLFAFRRTKWMTGGCARVVVCVYACVFPLVLTRFPVKSYSPRRTIGTAQKFGQQGGSLAIRMDCLVAYPKIQPMLLDASRCSLMG